MTTDTFFKKTMYYSFHALLFATPLIWTSKLSELFEFPKMLFVYAMTAIIVTAWLSRMIIQSKIIWQKTWFDVPFGLFALSQIISTVFSLNPHTSWFGYYSRFNGGLLSTLSYLTLYYAFVSNLLSWSDKEQDGINKFLPLSRTRLSAWLALKGSRTPKHTSFETGKISVDKSWSNTPIYSLLATTLAGAVIASLYALPEHFGKAFSCLGLGYGWITDCWSEATNPKYRAFGTFGQPNWLAAYLITLIFIPISQIYTNHFKSKKLSSKFLIPLVTFLLFFAVLLFTKSRSGLLGFGFGFMLFSLGSLIINRSRKTVLVLLAVSCLLTAIYGFFGKGIIPQIDRYLTPNTAVTAPTAIPTGSGTQLDNGGTESGDIRKIVWSGAWDVFRHHPLFGAGVETFGYSYYNYRPTAHNLTSEWDFLYNKAHNELLNHLANSGLFGLASYLLIMLSFIYFSFKNIFSKAGDEVDYIFRNRSGLSNAQAPTIKLGKNKSVAAMSDREKNDPRSQPLLRLAFLSGYLALAISNFFGFATVPVSLLFFLLPAFAFSPTAGKTTENKLENGVLSAFQNTLLFIVMLLGILAFYQVIRWYQADRAYLTGKTYGEQKQIQPAMTSLQKAIKIMPSEPVYKDEFAQTATDAALYFYEQNQATAGARIAELAISAADEAIAQNPAHLNFYKTKARLLGNLSAFQPALLIPTAQTLRQALVIAPTDAKLYFSLGMVYYQQQDWEQALTNIQTAIRQKPNYELARYTLGEIYESTGEKDKAIEQYRYIIDHIAPNNTKVQTKLEQMVK
ncbi:hypothetical protein A3B57_03585 [Microgenomates group bacterium RIFCSPLOWO2_01_FULL_47_10]|nr:MAG: hypothetical protein A3B57_03585 [Microgenomates group bacterium RIFCSPLOWO2_01_FULL_47_10]